jgi:hypothetical protein
MGLDRVELVMEIQTTFGVNVADSNATDIRTVGDLFDVIVELTATEPGVDRYSGELWNRYLVVIQQFTDLPCERLVPSARLEQDLGLD